MWPKQNDGWKSDCASKKLKAKKKEKENEKEEEKNYSTFGDGSAHLLYCTKEKPWDFWAPNAHTNYV